MVHFRPGSQVWQLITLLSFVGEFPFKSLSLLGSERVYKALISRLTTLQTIRNFNSGGRNHLPPPDHIRKRGRKNHPALQGCASHTGMAVSGGAGILHGRILGTPISRTHLTGTGTTGLRKLR